MTYHTKNYKTINDVPIYSYDRTKLMLERASTEMKMSGYRDKLKHQRNMAFFCISYLTGARINEILNIKLKDIMLSNEGEDIWLEIRLNTLKNRKNKTRVIPLLIGLEDWAMMPFLKFYIWIAEKNLNNPNQVLFDFNRNWGYKLCANYLNINHHFFRKIRATYQYRYYKLPPKTLEKFLGHSSLDAINPYLSITSEDIKEQINLVKSKISKL